MADGPGAPSLGDLWMYVALLALTVVVYALVCAFYLRQPACGWFHPLTIYLAFHGIVFVLRPILAWWYGYTLIYQVYLFTPDDYAKTMTLVVVNVGLLSFAYASLRWGNGRLTFKSDRFSDIELSALARPLWLVSLPLLPLAAYSLFQAWTLRASSNELLELDPATGTIVNTTGNGYVQFSYIVLITLLPLLALTGRFRSWWLGVVAFAALLMAGSGIRGPIISMLVCLGTLYLYTRRRRAPEWRIVAIAVVSLLAFNAIGADRGAQVRTLFGRQSDGITRVAAQTAPLEGLDFGNLEFVEFLVDKIPRDTRTYEYFVDNLQVFTEPIPRTLWRDKPIGQPIRFFYLFDYGYPIGMTRSLPGEGWAQLGLIGVILWCGLCGGVCGAIYDRFARGSQTPIAIALYAAFLSTLIVFYRDGTLVTLLRQGVFFVLPPLLWWLAARTMGIAPAAHLRLRASAAPRRRRDPATRNVADRGGDRDEEAIGALPAGTASGQDRAALPRSRRHPRTALPRG